MLIMQRYNRGSRDVAGWLADVETLRKDRMRFVMDFSLEATDTMLEGADPVKGTAHKNDASFQNRLKALYRNVGLPLDGNIELRRDAQ